MSKGGPPSGLTAHISAPRLTRTDPIACCRKATWGDRSTPSVVQYPQTAPATRPMTDENALAHPSGATATNSLCPSLTYRAEQPKSLVGTAIARGSTGRGLRGMRLAVSSGCSAHGQQKTTRGTLVFPPTNSSRYGNAPPSSSDHQTARTTSSIACPGPDDLSELATCGWEGKRQLRRCDYHA